jgi:AraC-like DNA-binding protein
MQSPYQEGQLISGEVWDSLVISFSEDDVQSVVRSLSGGRNLTPSFQGSVQLNQEGANWLRCAGLDLLKKSMQFSGEEYARFVAQSEQFKKLFLWRLVSAFDNSSARSRQSSKAAVVKQATDLVVADPSVIIGLTEICDNLQISLRSLHYAFHDVTGMSPATWLRRIRLNHVRKVLKNSTPGETKIKRVASDYGFLHLGHFSNQYQRFFDQLPSQTLRMN